MSGPVRKRSPARLREGVCRRHPAIDIVTWDRFEAFGTWEKYGQAPARGLRIATGSRGMALFWELNAPSQVLNDPQNDMCDLRVSGPASEPLSGRISLAETK